MIGGGGTSIPSHALSFADPRRRVLVGAGGYDPALGHKSAHYVEETAAWSAFQEVENPCGFVSFDVDPGSRGGSTTLSATYYAVAGPLGATVPVDRFTLTRPRRD